MTLTTLSVPILTMTSAWCGEYVWLCHWCEETLNFMGKSEKISVDWRCGLCEHSIWNSHTSLNRRTCKTMQGRWSTWHLLDCICLDMSKHIHTHKHTYTS